MSTPVDGNATLLKLAEQLELASAWAYRTFAESFTDPRHRELLRKLEQEELAHAARIRFAASASWRLSIPEVASSVTRETEPVALVVQTLKCAARDVSRSTREQPRWPHQGWSELVARAFHAPGGSPPLAEMFADLDLEHALQHRLVEVLQEARVTESGLTAGARAPTRRRR